MAPERDVQADAPGRADALDARAVRRAFGRAAGTYDAAAVLQREIGTRLVARLDYVTLAPRAVLDAGCGTGVMTRALAARYADATVTGIDVAPPMVAAARAANATPPRGLARLWTKAAAVPQYACADVRALPFAAGRFELAASNFTLQWVDDLPGALAELHRVLANGGLLAFTTLGPDTLRELRGAFADARPHVSRFVDMHDVGDMLVAAGFADPVVDMSRVTLTYAQPRDLLRELKALGATNATVGRARGLMGRAAYRRLEAGLEAARRDAACPRRTRSSTRRRGRCRRAPRPTAAPSSSSGRGRDARGFADARRRFRHRHGHRLRQDGGRRAARARARASGLRVAAMKPVAAGVDDGAPANDDVLALMAAANVDAPLADVNPYAFREAIAPHVAARLAGRAIDVDAIAAAHARAAARADVVVVEGAGGALVPGQRACRHAGHRGAPRGAGARRRRRAARRDQPCAADADAVRARGLPLAGWIANRIDPAMPYADDTLAAIAVRHAAAAGRLAVWRRPHRGGPGLAARAGRPGDFVTKQRSGGDIAPQNGAAACFPTPDPPGRRVIPC